MDLEQLLGQRIRSVEDLVDVQIGDIGNLLRIIATQYGTVYEALKEFISNAKDAGANYINVILNTKGAHPFVSIEDNGKGMDAEGLNRMKIVADSIKRMDPNTIGEKGIGHLAYLKLGQSAIYVSRGENDETGTTYQVVLETITKRTNPLPSLFQMDQPGTKVMIYELNDELKRSGTLTVKSVVRDLKQRYRDWLLQDPSVTIEVTDGREKVFVEPDPIPGIPLIEETIRVTYDGKNRPIYLQLKLRPVKGGKGRVGVSNHGERDIEDITARLSDFNMEPWTAEELEGVISADWVTWVANRSTLDTTHPSYTPWRGAVKSYEPKITETLQEHRRNQSDAEKRSTYRRAIAAYQQAFQDEELTNKFTPLGKQKYDTESEIKVPGLPRKRGGKRGKGPSTSGPGGTPDIDLDQEGNTKARYVPRIKVIERSLGTPHIMSSYVPELLLVEVNTNFPAYVKAMQGNSKDRLDYVGMVLSREVAHHNATEGRDISQAVIEIFCAMKPYLV